MRVIAVALLTASCDVGELSPAPDGSVGGNVGAITSPRHGTTGRRTEIVVEGLFERPGVAITIDRWDAGARQWIAAATATTASSPVDDLYAFAAAIVVTDAVWPIGGLVHLRARARGQTLAVFDDDATRCIEAQPTWRARIESCASSAAGVTLVDTDVTAPTTRHRFLDAKGSVAPEETALYYEAIKAPPTLAELITTYGLDGAPALTYYNAGDLATGREMHCAPQGRGVACYVRNYGVFGTAQSDAIAQMIAGHESGTGDGSFATVAMVYDPPIDAPNAVKFIVYGADGALRDQAQLDTHGDNVSIPHSCLNCHGSASHYDTATHAASGARFLPFDPAAFVFATVSGLRRSDQEDVLRSLNQMFLATSPSPPAAEMVRGWYGSGATLEGTADPLVVPTGWSRAPSLYRQVIATSCRTCHSSRDDALAFADFAAFERAGPSVARVICDPDNAAHAMPSAEASVRMFWAGPARAYLASALGPEVLGACAP